MNVRGCGQSDELNNFTLNTGVEIPIYRGDDKLDKPLAGLIRTLVLLASHEMIQMTGVV